MVAYSFHKMFAEPVASLRKRQTIRAERRRHARPGEPVQLYTAMRTRQCRKLLDVDPICLDVAPISLVIDANHEQLLAAVYLRGCPLNNVEIEQLAWDDGFGGALFVDKARLHMGRWWLNAHSAGQFDGVLIRWEPRP